ncbi:hypothetical protein [Salipiger sp.]
MTIDLTDIARGRRITALAARDLLICERHDRPPFGLVARALRFFDTLI